MGHGVIMKINTQVNPGETSAAKQTPTAQTGPQHASAAGSSKAAAEPVSEKVTLSKSASHIKRQSDELAESEELMTKLESGKLSASDREVAMRRVDHILKKYGG